MKTIKERKQFLRDNWKLSTLNFTWSKAGVCTLKNKRNEKLASAGGYGYDKKGTALGQVINSVFQEEIKKLSSKLLRRRKNILSRCLNIFHYLKLD